MYVQTPFPNIVYALDLNDDGKILWKYEPKQDPNVIRVMCCDTVNRGLAYADGKIFLHQADTTLVALDAKTGKVDWSVKTGDPSKGETGTDAPMIVKDKVMSAFRAASSASMAGSPPTIADGKQVWRAYSEGPDKDLLVDPEKTTELGKPIGADSSLKTWQGDQWKIGGGDTWGWYPTIRKLNLIYYGSGNPSTWNPKQRPGDNKWSMTIFARDPDTGMAKWVYQMTPHDQWDYDGVNEMILADSKIGGQNAPALVHFDRNGFGYTLNRETGELLVAAKYDPEVNWATKVDMDKSSPNYGRPEVVAKYATGQQRRKRQLPRASARPRWAPRTSSPPPSRRIPGCSTCRPTTSAWTMSRSASPTPRASPMSVRRCRCIPAPGGNNMGNFIAWDARQGKIVWSDPEQFSVWSGALATAGGVVFYGTLEGYLKAVDAKTGKELYRFKTPSGIIGNVMTYEHGGKQYVAVLSGVGGWAGIGLAAGLTDPHAGLGAVGGYAALSDYTALGGQLTVFALPHLYKRQDPCGPAPFLRGAALACGIAWKESSHATLVCACRLRSALSPSSARCPPSIAVTRGSGDPHCRQLAQRQMTDKDGSPTFKIEPDGTVDWYTYVGYIRYSANCLQCHGPDGLGSSYAPALINSLKHLSYADFSPSSPAARRRSPPRSNW